MEITSKDYRTEKDKKRQENLLNKMRNSEYIYIYANKILFKAIQLLKKHKFKLENIENDIRIIYFNEKQKIKGYSRMPPPKFKLKEQAIIKNGYSCDKDNMCKKLVSIDNLTEFIDFNKSNNISFSQIMGACYKFQINNTLVGKCLEKNTKLKNTMLAYFKKNFKVPNSFTFDDLKKLIKKSKGHWFYLWTLTFLAPKDNLFNRHLNEDEDYIRKWVMVLDNVSQVETKKIKKSDPTYAQYKNTDVKNVILGNTYMKPTNNSIWWNLMKKYKKQIIAGPSSSSGLCYQFIFDISNILEKTTKNKFLLLCLILCDYYPYFHSVSEILQIYTSDADLNKYDMEMDDVDYLMYYIKKYNLEEKLLNPIE
jgi:hypothetical protein